MGTFIKLTLIALFTFTLSVELAAKSKRVKKKRKAPGKSNLVMEAEIRKDKKSYDFDSMSIDGQRRVPLGNLINQKQANKDYEFVKIRLRWRQEMIQSASNLNL